MDQMPVPDKRLVRRSTDGTRVPLHSPAGDDEDENEGDDEEEDEAYTLDSA